MPEPNLPPLRLSYNDNERNPNVININTIALVELPEETRQNLIKNYDLSLELAVRLVNEPDLFELFMAAQKFQPKDNTILAHLILLDLVHICGKHYKEIENCAISPEFLAKACNMKINGEISQNLILKAFECAVIGDVKYDTFQELLNAKGWLTIFRNDEIIEDLIQIAIKEKPKVVKKYLKNKNPKQLNEMVQSVMSKNDILDPLYVKTILEKTLSSK